MMARSTTHSNQRPNTLMQDRICQVDETLLQRTAGPYIGSFSDLDARSCHVRGRDASYLAPPAQIRASPIQAHGSHLGCVTARRDILTKFRMRFSACDTVSRYCARPVLC